MPPDRHARLDPSALGDVDLRQVHPFQASKRYTCPGCGHEIGVGVGHLVAVPVLAPDLRRHWHHPCWAARLRRGRT